MFEEIFRNVKKNRPLIHCITNFVTANDCANVLLAAGASPIMAEDLDEAEDVTSVCGGLCLNLGTPTPRRLEAMVAAGKRANALGHPVVLDPVGVGASQMRMAGVSRLLKEVRFAAIRGNLSEIRTLLLGTTASGGVDADRKDLLADENRVMDLAKTASRRLGALIAISGATDYVTDGERMFCVHNGHPCMSAVTGTGCQLSALTAAFLTANPEQPLEAAAGAAALMGFAGEIAYARLSPMDGNASCRNYIIDAVYRMTPDALERGAKYEVR